MTTILALVPPRAARGAGFFIRFAYWMARRRFGRVPLPLAVMAHNRRVLASVALFETTIAGAHAADRRLKELAVLKTAMEVGCRFCIDIGAALSRDQGVTEDDLRALVAHADSPHWTPLEQKVLNLATAMSATPMTTPEALVAALREELGLPAFVELTCAIAWESFRARFNHAIGAKEEGYSDRMLCLLPAAPHG